MSLTGVIYGGIVVLWLCYLVPLALRRYDEASRARSVERFSTAMRVLGGETASAPPTPGRSLHARAGAAPAGAPPAGPAARPVDARAQRQAQHLAARAAARRRRRVLTLLLVVTLASVGAVVLGVAAWWVACPPVALVLGFLVAARTQVARARTSTWERTLTAGAETEPALSGVAGVGRIARPVGPVGAVGAVGPVGPVGDTPTVVLDALAPDRLAADPLDSPPQEVVAATVTTTDGGSLWDPLPVTLPTYVSKPRATRSVRTIDLGESAGRLADELAQTSDARSDDAREAAPDPEAAPARAVGH